MAEYPIAVLVGNLNSAEPVAEHIWDAVMACQALIDKGVVGSKQRHYVAVFARHVVEEKLKPQTNTQARLTGEYRVSKRVAQSGPTQLRDRITKGPNAGEDHLVGATHAIGIAGHVRGVTNTMPLHVEILYNEYNFVGAFAVASLLAVLALVTLLAKSFLEWRTGHGLTPVRRSSSP